MAKRVPTLPNLEPFLSAGINPATGLPYKMTGGCKGKLKDGVKMALRVIDEQDACNRYVWTGLPENITSQELERMLYYKGQLCFFKLKELNQYFFLPYALDGGLDLYGRFNSIHPVPFANGTDENTNNPLATYLAGLKLKCLYGGEIDVIPEDSCVLLHDYTKQLSQTIIARQIINDPLLDSIADCIPFMRTKLILGTGVKGVRVNDADQESSVLDGSRRLESAALSGEAYVPIVGTLEFQELAGDSASKSEEYMLAMKSLDNFRLSTYGITNGGLFEKKAHELQTEANVNGSTDALILQDGLEIRKRFCEIANAAFGTNMMVDINQSSMPMVEDEEYTDEEEPQGATNDEQDDTTI